MAAGRRRAGYVQLARLGVAAWIPCVSCASQDGRSEESATAPIYGGSSSQTQPPAVAVGDSCSGVLVHARVVVYASHCGTAINDVAVGDTHLAPEYCEAFPSTGVVAQDLAYCMLTSPGPVNAAVAPATGCEDGSVQAGTSLTIKGRGLPSFEELGATVTVQERGDALLARGPGVGVCGGDSGGPALVDLHMGDWGVRRLAGIISHGSAGCDEGDIWITPLAPLVPWLEARTGLDLTPCGDADGTWAPGPDCRARIAGDSGNGTNLWAFCGQPALLPSSHDAVPPEVALDVAELRDFHGSFDLTPVVDAIDVGWGVREVTLSIEGAVGASSSVRSLRPYVFPDLRLEAGRYRLTATAVDFAENSATEYTEIELAHTDDGLACHFAPAPSRGGARACALVWVLAILLAARARPKPEHHWQVVGSDHELRRQPYDRHHHREWRNMCDR